MGNRLPPCSMSTGMWALPRPGMHVRSQQLLPHMTQAQVEEEVEEATEKASKPLFSFLGGGGRGQQLKSQAVRTRRSSIHPLHARP